MFPRFIMFYSSLAKVLLECVKFKTLTTKRVYSPLQPEEMDFVETLLKCLWPEKREEKTSMEVDGWFAVAPDSARVAPKVAPQDLVADCLLTGVLASPSGPLLARLFHRLAAPLLWPRVNPLPIDNCSYRFKFEEVRLHPSCCLCIS